MTHAGEEAIVQCLICALGATAREVRTTLASLQREGHCGSCGMSPVASYLTAKAGHGDWYWLGTTEVINAKDGRHPLTPQAHEYLVAWESQGRPKDHGAVVLAGKEEEDERKPPPRE